MKKTIRKILEKIGSYFKGRIYKIDPELPLTSLFSLIYCRSLGVLRCMLYGVAFRPSKMIFIESGVVIKNRKKLILGRGVTLGKHALINGLSRDGVVLCDGVNIGPYTTIEATSVASNLGRGIYIGESTGIGGFSSIGGAGGVRIGRNVIMGQYVSFHSENHNFQEVDKPIKNQGVTRKGITIEDDCWIGAKVTVLDGAHVGRGCVIAAGSVVRGKITSYSVVAGVPGTVIRSRLEEI
jgi:acetyltransferase-like isoleucine patch superfamily enzyme